MATIVTRAGKGSPLTHNEVDANFTNLNSDKIESGDTVASLTLTAVDVADKITHSGDTNTSIRFPAADTVTIETAGSERVRVDSSGRVGIGTSSPSRIFEVSGTGSELMRLERTGSTSGVGIEFKNDSGDFAMFGNASGAGTGAFIPQGDGDVDLGSSGNRFKDLYLSGSVILNGCTISAIQVTVADDAVAQLTFLNRRFGILSVVEGSDDDFFPDTGDRFFGYVDFGNTPGSSTISAGGNTEIDDTNTLTGTTGTDGKVTIGTAGTSGTLYLENRRGGTKTFNVTLM
jgi:hypothetical protein